MGNLDWPDPIRDEDIWVNAHALCAVRDCATPGCEQDARLGKKLCEDCGTGRGQLGLRLLMAKPHPEAPIIVANSSDPTRVSPAELLVLQCAADGMTARQTATHLGKRLETIRTQVCRAKQKLGTGSISEAVAIAFRAGLVT